MRKPIPMRTFNRLVDILKIIEQAPDKQSFSSGDLALELGVSDILIRKDLNSIGLSGRPKIGFDRTDLVSGLEGVLGYTRQNDAILVGCGRLGRSLLDFSLLDSLGISLVAGFDLTPSKIGRLEILPLTKMPSLIKRLRIRLALLCVPEDSAQATADQLVAAGIQVIWNFTATTLHVPEHVHVHQEDLRLSAAHVLQHLHREEQ
ncbi:MAG TPA: redox-sensing transcriptional repressor Rex [Tissierellia bacterium]|nr:redox-sensing transcriptional repressor Rex [Tissierellia bacterium]